MKKNQFAARVAILSVVALFLLGGAALVLAGDAGDTGQGVVSTFRVDGMTCGGCAAGIRLNVKKLDGVEEVKVSHEENSARVSYDPHKVTVKQIVETIEKLGYTAKLEKTEDRGA